MENREKPVEIFSVLVYNKGDGVASRNVFLHTGKPIPLN